MRVVHYYTKPTSRSRSGHLGVYITGGRNGEIVYQARISYEGKEIYLGCTRDLQKAIKMRRDAENRFYGGI